MPIFATVTMAQSLDPDLVPEIGMVARSFGFYAMPEAVPELLRHLGVVIGMGDAIVLAALLVVGARLCRDRKVCIGVFLFGFFFGMIGAGVFFSGIIPVLTGFGFGICYQYAISIFIEDEDREYLCGDLLHLACAMATESWWGTAVSESGRRFMSEAQKRSECDSGSSKAECVRLGLDAVDLDGDFEDVVERMSREAAEVMQLGTGLEDCLGKCPELVTDLEQIKLNGPDVAAFERGLVMEMVGLSGEYQIIRQRYSMLCDGFARYEKIVSGWPVLRGLLNVAAMFADDILISIAEGVCEAWGTLKGMKDGEYVKGYEAASHGFIVSCARFAEEGCEIIAENVMAQQERWNQRSAELNALVLRARKWGVKKDHIENCLAKSVWRTIESAFGHDASEVVSLAILRMTENELVPWSRMRAIIRLLRKGGCPIASDGTLRDSSARKRVKHDGAARREFRDIGKYSGGANQRQAVR